LLARSGHDRIDRTLQHILVHAAVVVEQAERPFELVDRLATLRMCQAFEIDPVEPIHHAEVSCLREERRLVDETPHRKEAIERACVAVVAQDLRDLHHRTVSRSTRSCLPGSYRFRARDEASRMRNMSRSCFVAQSAKPYSPANINRPARNE